MIFVNNKDILQVKLDAPSAPTQLPFVVTTISNLNNKTSYYGTVDDTTAVQMTLTTQPQEILSINLTNIASGTFTVTIEILHTGTITEVGVWTLSRGNMLTYEASEGWKVLDEDGNLKVWDSNASGSGSSPTSAEFSALVSVVNAEISNRISAVNAVSNALSVEISNRTSADTALQAAINVVSNALSVEISNRISAVNAVSNALSVEISNRTSADNALSAAIDVVSNALSAEIINRISAVNAVSNALSVEISNRVSADAALSAAINTVSNALSAEILNRISADNVLSAAINVVSGRVDTLSVAVSNLISAQPLKTVVGNSQVFSVSTLANVSGMAFTVSAGNIYNFRFLIIFSAAATTTGLKIGLTFPAMTSFGCTVQIPQGNTSTANFLSEGHITTTGQFVQAASATSANTNLFAIVDGVCQPSGTGTLQLQGAASVGGTDITIQPATLGTLWKIV